MNSKTIYSVILLLVIALATTQISIAVEAQAVKGPKVDVVTIKAIPLDQAVQALRSGDIDYYIFGLRPSQAAALIGAADIKVYNAPAGINSFILNPAPDPNGLNPLSLREVRFAINYLINKDYVVTTVYKGLASAMYCHLSSYDPDYSVVFDVIAKYEFKYSPAVAEEIITNALTKAGAEKVGDKWYYKGNPITLKFIIRVEDERRVLGDMLATELEKVGFRVERIYSTFREAIPVIYGTDPKDFKWHIYTEGWGKSVPDKYDYSTINQFYAPWFGWMPGYQEPDYWNYENSTIDDLGKKIYRGEFTTKEERDDLYRRMTELGILESVRIFVITTLDSYPARNEVAGLTLDLGTGLRSPFNFREAYVPGKNTLKVGHLWVWTEGTAWNPVGGFDDVYSVDIWRSVYDPWIWRNPFNGLPIPFRVAYTVETAGPKGSIKVPSDAFIWDAGSRSWKSVGDDVTALSKVTFDLSKLIGSKWHHGITITWADILFPIYQAYDMTYNETKAAVEGSIAASNKEVLPMYKGFRIVGDKYLEVYIDYWHFDENYIAEMAVPPGYGAGGFASNPWELVYATDFLVFDEHKYGYSESTAEKLGVPWLSLVLKTHAEDVKKKIESLLAGKVYPDAVFTLPGGKKVLTVNEALERYEAAIKWINTYGHAEISNGPFYVYLYDPANQYCELRAFRDPTYPFGPGSWYFGMPERVEIVNVGLPTIVPGGDAQILVELKGPTPLHVKYLIKDPITGYIVTYGSASQVAPDRFIIQLSSELTSKLRPGGVYETTIIGYSDETVLLSTEKHFLSILNIQPLQAGIVALAEQLRSDLATVTKQVTTVSNQVSELGSTQQELISKVNASIGSLTTAIYLLIVLVIVDIVVTLFVGRRK
ncbi:MAG: ABC transporter substrate-binding protein [Sulfolobales archaeon]